MAMPSGPLLFVDVGVVGVVTGDAGPEPTIAATEDADVVVVVCSNSRPPAAPPLCCFGMDSDVGGGIGGSIDCCSSARALAAATSAAVACFLLLKCWPKCWPLTVMIQSSRSPSCLDSSLRALRKRIALTIVQIVDNTAGVSGILQLLRI